MDDRLDIGNRSVGGPHPHAGFETVTLILDGAIYDRDEGGALNAGEVQWMTAGSGVPIRFLCATNPEQRSVFTVVRLEVFIQAHETMCP